MLLLIHGSGGDMETYRDIIDVLSKRYTVVTYDRRNCGRSTPKSPSRVVSISEHGDDANCLLEILGAENVNVFGSSAGATIGLDLVSRHPERVRALVAHEPPIVNLLPDAPALHESFRGVLETAKSGDLLQATMQFLAVTGILGANPGSSLQMVAKALAGRPSLFCEIDPITCFVPDVARLRACKARVIVASGEAHAESMPCRASQTLAALLDVPLCKFPGNHLGYMNHPDTFAATLNAIFNHKR